MQGVSALTHRVDEDGILRIEFDTPGGDLNLLTGAVLQSLSELFKQARERDEIRAVMIGSAKPGCFLAGMDVTQIAAIPDSYEAAEGARRGQAVFQQLAELGKPTAVAISGTCLGGGVELALACDFRIATDHPTTRIGLPEIKLGLIPGFGGTQRLPRLVGTLAAIDLIVSGRTLDCKTAAGLGLVDRVVPVAYLEREAAGLLQHAITDGVIAVTAGLRRRRPASAWLIERVAPLRKYIFDRARNRTTEKVDPASYPAPFHALEALSTAVTRPLIQGLDFEARMVGILVPTVTCKNLIWLFRNRTALTHCSRTAAAVPRKVNRLAILGAGSMGRGIARLAAEQDIPLRLLDHDPAALLAALRAARTHWTRDLQRKRITASELDQRIACISTTRDDSGLTPVDLVIESVDEDLSLKRKLLAQVERKVSSSTIIATNSSSLPVADIAAGALHPERVVGMHFFPPLKPQGLVEIVASTGTSAEAVSTVRLLAIRFGMVPVLVRDGPGFLVSRILALYFQEAIRLLLEGLRVDAIDQAMVQFGMPVGPFELLDRLGLKAMAQISDLLHRSLGARFSGGEAVLTALTDAGRLGVASERGFYLYRQGKRRSVDRDCYRLAGTAATTEVPAETLQERLVLSLLNEAVFCLQDGVVSEPRDIDLAIVLAAGFPPFRGGLLRYADSAGIPLLADRLARLADAHGERFRPAELWSEMVRGQRKFYV
jgi:3-hydroxyacyl-CoA dehydrogenase/enoyl-CoA hydratase/3-hydroxybutyryl-CoA epimerase